jgi:hypothetical protein
VNEKILLFLLDYNKHRDSKEVPFAVSQKGISEGVEIRITHIPRAVQKLLDEDYIKEFKTHFRGHLRKRKAYFLTESGTDKAVAIKNNVGAQMVTLKTKDEGTLEKKLLDMYEGFGRRMNFFEFYKLSTKHSVLDESILEKYYSTIIDQGSSLVEDFKDFRHNIPGRIEILGRSNELSVIDEWFLSPDQRVIVISGPKGIGKSALGAEAVRKHMKNNYIMWLNFQKGSCWDNLIHAVVELTSINNYFKLDKYVKRTSNIIPAKAFELLTEEFADLKLLVVLDDIHKIEDGLNDLDFWLLPLLKSLPAWKIFITSREGIPVKLRSNENLEGKYKEVKLTGLDIETSRKLIQSDLSTKEFEGIYKYTDGNPLYLKALKDMEKDGKIDLKNFRPEELSLLKYLKVYEEID